MGNQDQRQIPKLIRLAIVLAVFGYCFPVYGVPFFGFKATFGRIGLALLVVLSLLRYPKWRIRSQTTRFILGSFVVLGVWRLLSLVTLGQFNSAGLSQISWFSEGVLFLYVVVMLDERYDGISQFLLRTTFIIGLLSIGAMVIQFVLLLKGSVWALPLSTSAFGFPPGLADRGYPIGGGGRILGGFFEPNMSGTMCALYFATFLPFVLMKSDHGVANRPIVFAAIVLTLVAVMATGSRQGLLTIALSVVVLLAVGGIERMARQFVRLLPILLALIAIAYAGRDILSNPQQNPTSELPKTTIARLLTATNARELTGGRNEFIREALENLTLGVVVWGVGESKMEVVTMGAPHNAFVVTLIECGAGGFLVLLVLSWSIVFAPLRAYRRSTTRDAALFAGGFLVSVSWVTLIFVNWAQLNQTTCYLFLAIALLAVAKHSQLVQLVTAGVLVSKERETNAVPVLEERTN